jgi:hypothetical protein
MRKLLSIALGVLLLGTAAEVTVIANPAAARSINHRQYHQSRRIYNGIRRGSLTYRESYRLYRQQGRIARLEHRYRRDGRLSRWERRSLNRRLNHSSRLIYRLNHNRRWY